MALQQFLGKFALGTADNTFSLGATTINLATGNYYIDGYTGEATQLCAVMQTAIRALGATQDASTVVYSGTTGRITITLETAATLTFDDANLATLLGYTSTTYSSRTSFVAERQPRYVWRPSRSAMDYPINLSAATFWIPGSTSVSSRSNDGTSWGVQGNQLYDGFLTYASLLGSEVITPITGTVCADFQQFFSDVIHAQVGPIRFYPDRTVNTSSDYIQFNVGKEKQEQVGSFLTYANRNIKTYNGLWDVRIPMMKYI